jgi:hypothetical protein
MLPVETRLALFPAPHRVRLGAFRSLVLQPLTLGRAAAMEIYDCGLLGGRLSDSKALIAAWLLSVDERELPRIADGDVRGARRFVRSLKGAVAPVVDAVSVILAESVLPLIPPKAKDNEKLVDDGLPRGCGWPLEMAEALCAHYGWPTERAMATPVQTAVALLSVGRARGGGAAGGPDYFGRIRLARLRAAGIIGKAEDNG